MLKELTKFRTPLIVMPMPGEFGRNTLAARKRSRLIELNDAARSRHNERRKIVSFPLTPGPVPAA